MIKAIQIMFNHSYSYQSSLIAVNAWVSHCTIVFFFKFTTLIEMGVYKIVEENAWIFKIIHLDVSVYKVIKINWSYTFIK